MKSILPPTFRDNLQVDRALKGGYGRGYPQIHAGSVNYLSPAAPIPGAYARLGMYRFLERARIVTPEARNKSPGVREIAKPPTPVFGSESWSCAGLADAGTLPWETTSTGTTTTRPE